VFVSVAGPDLAWGRWVDRQLRDAGYQVDFGTFATCSGWPGSTASTK
jgi:hypothetical protein